MKTKQLLIIGVLSIVSTILFFSFTADEELGKNTAGDKYHAKIQEHRQQTDTFFKTDKKSPLPKEERADFKGLNYFDIDISYSIVAKMKKIKNAKPVSMETSKHQEKSYLPYAKAHFRLNGKKCELTIYKSVKQDYLFLPFTDLTTGKQSYGAGRYIEVEELADKKIVIDFNIAYNPYCAYSDNYNCPYPPAENDLKIRIEAGERTYH